ncbi:hypothetical protein CDAR_118041 [Caerostris darwini]|uniref:Uncharacterized protein n=1 Tax=Caerostris darwini TaxID=1538125 RepID=A0AAV4UJ19_9ARAC|nr:hypothetical protein CDAR_118041 [Caerostris darwini]
MSRPCGLLQAQPDRPTHDLRIFSFLSGSSDHSTIPPDLTRPDPNVRPCLTRLYISQFHFRTALTSRKCSHFELRMDFKHTQIDRCNSCKYLQCMCGDSPVRSCNRQKRSSLNYY